MGLIDVLADEVQSALEPLLKTQERVLIAAALEEVATRLRKQAIEDEEGDE